MQPAPARRHLPTLRTATTRAVMGAALAMVASTALPATAAVRISPPVLVNARGAIDEPSDIYGLIEADGLVNDGGASGLEVASCGDGMLLAVWIAAEIEDNPAGLLYPKRLTVRAATSADGGATWVDRGRVADSALDDPDRQIPPNGAPDEVGVPRVACSLVNGQRVWLVTHARYRLGQDAANLLLANSSIDDGAHWGGQVDLSPGGGVPWGTPVLAAVGQGRFVAAYDSSGFAANRTCALSISVDAAGAIPAGAIGPTTCSLAGGTYPTLASDGSAHILWSRVGSPGLGFITGDLVDDDIVWDPGTLAAPRDSNGTITYAAGGGPFLPYDLTCAPAPSQTCLATHLTYPDNALAVDRTDDGGQTFASLPVVGAAELPFQWPTVAYAGDGAWIVVWPTSGGNLRFSTSVDDGLTWSAAGDLHVPGTAAAPGNGDHFFPVASGGQVAGHSRYVILFPSTWTMGDTLGADSDILSITVEEVCGNGAVDADVGEECDPGPRNPGDCCSNDCQLLGPQDVCRAAADVCDVVESCDGALPTCPADQFALAGTACRAASGSCGDPAETCDGAASACPADSDPLDCKVIGQGNDSIVCTQDMCEPGAAGADAFGCRHVPDDLLCADSQDAIACTHTVCQPEQGGPASGCVHLPDDTLCDDDLYCNGAESCATEVGCLAGSAPVLSDGLPCTTDSCDEANNRPAHLPDDSACDDGLYCNGAESCATDVGCLAGSAPVLSDGLACTTDSCDEVNDRPAHVPDDAVCNDGLYCNGTESCATDVGCLAGSAPVLSDGVACTTDGCDEINDQATHLPDDSACDDGLYCNGAESCATDVGCLGGSAPVLSDDVACTTDGCDEAGDQVTHLPDDAACADTTACTVEVCDLSGGCSSTPDDGACDDANPCTDDACDPNVAGGCTHTPRADGTACTNDGLACTADVCANGICRHLGDDSACDDGFACTKDTCSTQDGCHNGAVDTECADGVACTVETCAPSAPGADADGCVVAPDDTLCDDGLGCTSDVCDPTADCQHADPCADDDLCSIDTCFEKPGEDPDFRCENDLAPRQGCFAASGSLTINDHPNPLRRSLVWSWGQRNAPAVPAATLGDPASDDYALCLWDRGTADPKATLWAHLDIPPGLFARPARPFGWKVAQQGPVDSRIIYTDAAGRSDGVTVAKILSSSLVPGRAAAALAASGQNLPLGPPALPGIRLLDPYPLEVQLVRQSGACWQTTFSDADIRRNDARRFIGQD